MTAAAAFADLEGLLDLVDGNAADMCARLLRTLTDLYLQRPIHTPEDEHYYTELALRLIDAAALSERAALAARLASYPSAPYPFWSDWRAMRLKSPVRFSRTRRN
jgi:hypothetical protein